MSDNNEMKNMNEMKEINWIEEAISRKHIKYFEYEEFNDVQVIGAGGFGKVYRANRKNHNGYFALKTFFNLDQNTLKAIARELEIQRDVNFHDNIIRFWGITKFKSGPMNEINYGLVMEYADGGTLRNHLKENFTKLTWVDKYKLAYQLSNAVLCLHGEKIVHRDLHSCNVLIHQGKIKLADFGLSRRIGDSTNSQSKTMGVAPYMDPKKFILKKEYSLNTKSDVYSVGVLLWEISSGKSPFENDSGFSLAVRISQGLRETAVPDTPADYVNLYTECWDGDPEKRPTMNEVVERLSSHVDLTTLPESSEDVYFEGHHSQDISSDLSPQTPGELSRLMNDFANVNTASEITAIIPTSTNRPRQNDENTSLEVDLDKKVDEIVALIFEEVNKGNGDNVTKKHVLDYLEKHNISSREIYNRLISGNQDNQENQNNSNSIFLLGYFNYYGIETVKDLEQAFKLFNRASQQDHMLAQCYAGNCYRFGYGTTKNEKSAFEYFKKIADRDFAIGQIEVGYCYEKGTGIKKDLRKSVDWYSKAAEKGNVMAKIYLGILYQNGNGVDKDYHQAFKLFKESAEGEHLHGIMMLGYCYKNGIGTNIDKKQAFELYEKAAELGSNIAQYNLANMYRKGEGTKKDDAKAIRWYEESAKQGYKDAQNRLNKLKSRSCNVM